MRKFRYFFGLFFWIIAVLLACRSDDLSFDAPTQELRFSKDTIFCDTVYSQVRSETYSMKVYNMENKDIKIPKIYLGGGAGSQYKINIDGKSGHSFVDVPLRAKDSLYVFIEIAPNSSVKEAVAQDYIKFENSFSQQSVTLFSVVQDVEFFNGTPTPYVISSDATWNNDKAKVILGEVIVSQDKTLTIGEGTKIYFHKNSGMVISRNATLNVNGDLDKEVVFRGERNSIQYDTIPKTWDGLVLEEGSKLNMNYAKMQGGNTALYLNEAVVKIKNTIIHTFNDYGIYSIGSDVGAENLVMNNFGQSAIAIFKGGNYDLKHVTIANYWNMSFAPALAIFAQNEHKEQFGNLVLKLINSIVYTKIENAIKFKPTSGHTFNYTIKNCLVKHEDNSSGFSWSGNSNIISSLRNKSPLFLKTNSAKLNLRIHPTSPALGIGNIAVAASVALDIKKTSRTTPPNSGAYQ